jgi:hypothetical protein
LLPQSFEQAAVVRQFGQDLFHLRYDIVLIRKRHLVAHLWMNDISRPAEVHNYRYGAACESFEDYSTAEVSYRWKHERISRSQVREDFRMAEPAAEDNSLLDPKRFHKLLEAIPLPAVADHGEARQAVPQKRSRRAQGKIASLPRN